MSCKPEDLLGACNHSVDASRRPLVIVVIAYVIVFCMVWNARNSSWQNSYIRSAGAAIQWLGTAPEVREATPTDSRLAAGRLFVETYGLDDPTLIRWAIEHIQASQIDKVLFVELPLFNVSIHINDLGVYSGLTFMILLIWYRQCLAHHLACMKLALRRDSLNTDEQLLVRQLLAMHQFFTVPASESPLGLHVKRTIQLLFLAPAVVWQAYLAWTNWTTRELAFALGASYAVPILSLTSIFFIIVTILVASCHQILGLIATELQQPKSAKDPIPPAVIPPPKPVPGSG